MATLSQTCWPVASLLPRLGPGETQVWRVELGHPAVDELLDACDAVLSAAERARATVIRSQPARQELIAARGCLRLLLEAATGTPAARLVFETGPQGKPSVASAGAPAFNVAHSHGVVLIALTRTGRVGVDVERMDCSIDADEVARDVFHARELARMAQAADEAERLDAFYTIWTRKEAACKLDGRGLNLPLAQIDALGEGDDFAVALPGAGAACVRALPVFRSWRGEQYHAAVALERPGCAVDVFAWPGLSSEFAMRRMGHW